MRPMLRWRRYRGRRPYRGRPLKRLARSQRSGVHAGEYVTRDYDSHVYMARVLVYDIEAVD
jgi:hypothetical protein